ncbi:MAG: tetratricopeptide repeat protein [Candidatus Aminicenantes bacterium]|nr:tetratricopeptide repeat protein [Candidatus Aminicenantes bacterium]MCJ7486125.1 tetratricopeptide repeat protein [Candidatus Aminicenantes bacterium]
MKSLRFHPAAFTVLFFLFLASPLLGQYREYYIIGIVTDTQKNPLEGVEITLRDAVTSRSFTLKTKKSGEFKFAGLPRGDYRVVLKKDGYAVKEDQWKLLEPKAKMEKVEIPPITMVSEEVVQEVQRLKETEAGVKAASEKIRQEDFDGALAGLKTILEKNPQDPNALYLTGIAYLRKNMPAEASSPLLKVTELSPKFAAAFYQLGVCYQRQEQPDKALAEYEKAIALEPGNPDVFFNAGLLLFGLTRIDEALAHFEKALALRPDDPAYLEMAGRCYINKAEFPKAIEYMEKAKAGTTDPERIKFLDDLIATLKAQIKK